MSAEWAVPSIVSVFQNIQYHRLLYFRWRITSSSQRGWLTELSISNQAPHQMLNFLRVHFSGLLLGASSTFLFIEMWSVQLPLLLRLDLL